MDRERIEKDIAQLAPRLDARSSSPYVKDIDKGDHEVNVVVLGATRVGKSTVISFLFGDGRLVVHRERPNSRVLVAESPLRGVVIRSGVIPSTLLPVVNHVELEDGAVAVWDMPGTQDLRDPFVELVVHFIFQWMLRGGKKLKFIIVSPPLNERPQAVMLERMLNSSLVRGDNAVFVYTKCGTDFDPDSASALKSDESKRSIRSFALLAPANNNAEGHEYSCEYSARKREILTTLSDLSSCKVEFNVRMPDGANFVLDWMTKAVVKLIQDKLSSCFLKLFSWDGHKWIDIDTGVQIWANIALVSPLIQVAQQC